MKISEEDLISVLSQFNPWWRGEKIADLPLWHRAVYRELFTWIKEPPVQRAVLLSGARQVGKTTLILQAIDNLIQDGVPPANILYATFDHPILKMAGIEAALSAWRAREPKQSGAEYVFLDEAHSISGWGTWIKHQVDFNKGRRVIFTGSATPLLTEGQESGVGRWHTIRLTTLSFFEYLKIKRIDSIRVPSIKNLRNLYEWPLPELLKVSNDAQGLLGHFHEYLLRGGFPQTALAETITYAQRLLREDIIDKVLKRDMTAIFGVRKILDLEKIFFYLCMHDGGLLDMTALQSNLEVKKQLALSHIDLLEAAHLIYKLPPFGYGKEILRAKYKIYLADAAIPSAVLLKGKATLEDPTALGKAAEAAVFKHVFARYYAQNVRFTYFKGKKQEEIDLVAEVNGETIPFEIKYRSHHATAKELKGLIGFCDEKKIERAYVVTKNFDDIGRYHKEIGNQKQGIMRIPAALFCYWMGETELQYQKPGS